MKPQPLIRLFGSKACHKTKYYLDMFNDLKLDVQFLDVVGNEANAKQLRSLYTNKKLNFPTITIGDKKLRNPTDNELTKWIDKLID